MNPEKRNPRGGARLEQNIRRNADSQPPQHAAPPKTAPPTKHTAPRESQRSSQPQRVAPPSKKAEPPKRTRGQIIRQRVLIIATVIAALIVLLYAVWHLIFIKPDVDLQTPILPLYTDNGSDQSEWSGTVPKQSGDRKKDFFTFLVIGRDTGGGGNTDTILLAAYDVANQKLNVMSVPRDTMVNIPYDIKRINAVYNYAGGGDDGIKALSQEISQLVGFVPDFQVVVEWDAVGQLVDALGGVYFDVPRNMNYDDPTQNLHIHIKKGPQTLNGKDAMGVIRYRHDNDIRYGYPDGDLGRIKTQQAFLKEVVKQCLQIQNVTRIGELAQVFSDNVTTNLSVNNLFWFGKEAILGGLKMEDVNFITMPNTGATAWSKTYHSYQSYVVPNADELIALVNECFNPYLDELKEDELDIMFVKDGVIGSSTGRLEDKSFSNKGGNSSGGNSGSLSTPKPRQTTSGWVETPPPATRSPKPVYTEPPSESPEESLPPEESPNISEEPVDTPEPPPTAEPTPPPADTPTPPPAPPETEPPSVPSTVPVGEPDDTVLPPPEAGDL